MQVKVWSKKLNRLFFSTNNGIKPPQNPTMAESFGTKVEKKDLEKFMNPLGFLNESDKKDYDGIQEDPNTQKDEKKEYGFKIKGPEPTRFGDWERKGRCTDF